MDIGKLPLDLQFLSSEMSHLLVVAIAGCLGALIGLERELSDKPAGLRTHIFVAAGSALLMLLADAILDNFKDEGQGVINADPIRVMQAIVIGISFLGAGTIIHQGDDRVQGLTTAASIFLTAGIGIATALGLYTLAVGTSIYALIVLTLMGLVEKGIQKRHRRKRKNKNDDRSSNKSSGKATILTARKSEKAPSDSES